MSEKKVRGGKRRDARFLKSSETKTRKGKWIWILVLLLVCFAVTGVFQGSAQLKRAKALKGSIVEYGQNLLMQNSDGAQAALDAVDASVLEIRESLDNPFWKITEAIPFLGKNVTTARSAVDLLDEASQKLLEPAIGQVCRDPAAAPQLADTAQSCFEFAVTVLPDVRQIVSSARELDLGLFDVGGKLSGLLTTADELLKSMESGSDTVLTPLVQHMQKYPLSELGIKKLLDYQCLHGYVKALDQSIPLVRDAAAELQSSELMGGDNQYLNASGELLDILETVCGELLYPLCDQLRAHPVSSVILEEGYDAEALADYIAFAREAMPHAEQILEDVQALELDILTENETVAHALLVCNNLRAFYHQNEDILDFAEILLADGEDRLYLLAAQNSAEIRASGGFPGAMGVLRIRDGIMTIGDFAGVNDVLAVYASGEAEISFAENRLFNGEINVCRDACYCPDFERVASIWALGYELKNKEELDGVLSLTPALIQKVLGPTDEILLSDGTKLTSENATRILQHDLYFQYFLNGADVTKANKAVDALFVETAKKAMSTIISGLNVQKILSYPDVIREGFDNRTLMVWMRDEEEQAFVRELGWNGSLNADPNAPEVGIYFSNVLASKMGWFIEIYPEVGEPEENEDGSLTYPVTVRFHNTITKQQVKDISSQYILGGDGRIRGLIHFFAPAGGSIGGFKVEGSSMMPEESEYKGLQLGYVRKVDILPESFVEYSFEVTTAPGVQVPPELSMTPTLQGYK